MKAPFPLSASSARQANGFTLTELMLSIGLISVLLLLLVTGWSSMRARAETVTCMQRMRQTGSVALMRAQEHRGYLLWKDLAYSPYTDEQMWKTPLLRENRITDPKAFFCPSSKVVETLLKNPYLGFGLRSCDELRTTHPELLGGTWGALPPPDGRNAGTRMIALNRIEAPARFILWADSTMPNHGGAYSGLQSTNFSLNTRSGTTSGIQLRHQGRANVMFADGHMGSLSGPELKEYGAVSAYDAHHRVVTF